MVPHTVNDVTPNSPLGTGSLMSPQRIDCAAMLPIRVRTLLLAAAESLDRPFDAIPRFDVASTNIYLLHLIRREHRAFNFCFPEARTSQNATFHPHIR